MLHLNSCFNKIPHLIERTYLLNVDYLAPGWSKYFIIVFLVINNHLAYLLKMQVLQGLFHIRVRISKENSSNSGFLKRLKLFLSLGKFGKLYSDTNSKNNGKEIRVRKKCLILLPPCSFPNHLPSFSFSIPVNNAPGIQHFIRVRNLLVCNLAKSKKPISERFPWEHKISGYTLMSVNAYFLL